MNEQKHIINRQVLELTVPERGHAQHIQNRIAEIVKQKLLHALDVLFTGMSGRDEIIRINKLEINLGVISENELENELVEMAIKEIKSKINKQMISGSKTANSNFIEGKNANLNREFTATTKSKDFLEQFIYFSQTGHLPWWQSSSGTDLIGYIFKEALNVDSAVFNREVIPLLRKPKVRQRLIYQLNHSQLHTFLKKLNDKLLESYSAQFQDLYSFFNSGSDKKTVTESFYEIALLYFSMELELTSDELKIGFIRQVLSSVLLKLPGNEKETFLLKILDSDQLKHQESLQKETSLILAAVIHSTIDLQSHSNSLEEIIRNLPVKNEKEIFNLVEQFLNKTQKVAQEKIEDKKEKPALSGEKISQESELKVKHESSEKPVSLFSPQSFADDEQIIVLNAGLVLVHPFLRYFFEGLNLLDNELKFKSQSDAFKAVHLLQFIATGMELTEEINLPLNKILCGLDVNEPVPKNALLSDEEKEECIFLIKTALERWEALKTTNPAALRETYLQREGILKRSGQSWTLVVERNTFDVMLEKLPWSFSFVKLPWCEQILYVEW